jgi:aspartate carbamoyltransferase catalytic subunit
MEISTFPQNLLTADDLGKNDLFRLFDKAKYFETHYNAGDKFLDLRNRSVVLAFFENSTRTRNSFEVAAKRLSANILTFTASASSLAKGESLADTIRTLDAMLVSNTKGDRPDVLWVIRNQYSGVPQFVHNVTKNIIINAGDGKHEHPTQASLDAYTIWQHYGKVNGLNISIVGDILNSRVARSNITMLKTLGAEVRLFAPGTLLPVHLNCWNVELHRNMDEVVEWSDAVIMLRLQNERMDSGLLPSVSEYRKFYQMNAERFIKNEKLILLHPGPVNYGVELEHSITKLQQSMIDRQVTNGVFVRMALMSLLANG